MLKAEYSRRILRFKEPARTSRGTLTYKETYFLKVYDATAPDVFGIGECALFRGLSCDDTLRYEELLADMCRRINDYVDVAYARGNLRDTPSLLFGLETAMLDLRNGGVHNPFPGPWSRGEESIAINGLVWMGCIEKMQSRIEEKLESGCSCLKFKVGGEDFDRELALLTDVRRRYDPAQLEIRLDANGAFTPDNAMARLDALARLDIHSIEQPIRQGQWDKMAHICRVSPIPIALDEELIGINDPERKYEMLETIRPAYIILKPTLCGSFSGAMEWISMARLTNVGWWSTSALESNVGLNAIAQWAASLHPTMPQGLGTGALYHDNIPSPVMLSGNSLVFDPSANWDFNSIEWHS